MSSFRSASKALGISRALTSLVLNGGNDCIPNTCKIPDLLVEGGARIKKNLCIDKDLIIVGDTNICGDLTVKGNLIANTQVDLVINDKVVCLANVPVPTDVTANGGGIMIFGPQPGCSKSFLWYQDVGPNGSWYANYDINLGQGRVESSMCGSDILKSGTDYRIDGESVLNATTLGDGVLCSSLQKVGTLRIGSIFNGIEIINITAPSATPTVTTSEPHNLTTGDKVLISGTDSTPSIDGCHTVTVSTPTTFTVPVPTTFSGSMGYFQSDAFPIDIGLSTIDSGTHTIRCAGDLIVKDDNGFDRFTVTGASGKTVIDNIVEKDCALEVISDYSGDFSNTQSAACIDNTTNNNDTNGISSALKIDQCYDGTNTSFSDNETTVRVVGETINVKINPKIPTPRVSARGIDVTSVSTNNLGTNIGVFGEAGGAVGMMQATGVVGIANKDSATGGMRVGVVGCVNHDRDSIATEFANIVMGGGLVAGGYFCEPTGASGAYALVTMGKSQMDNVCLTGNIDGGNVNTGMVCATNGVRTNTISPKSGSTITMNAATTVFNGDIIPSANVTYDIGSPTRKIDNLYVSNVIVCGQLFGNINANAIIPNVLNVDIVNANTLVISPVVCGNIIETDLIRGKTDATIEIEANLIPIPDNTLTLGNSTNEFKNIYVHDIYVGGNVFGTIDVTTDTVIANTVISNIVCANTMKTDMITATLANIIAANIFTLYVKDLCGHSPITLSDSLIPNKGTVNIGSATNKIDWVFANNIVVCNDLDGNMANALFDVITSNVVCVNTDLFVNTIKPKSGGTVTIDGNLVVTGSFLSNILANIPEPLVVNTIIADTVCAFGNVETNSIKAKTGNTITVSDNIVANNLTGNTYGTHFGNTFGKHFGDVCGNVMGDVTGNLTGNTLGTHTGPTIGDVTGNLTGNTLGTHIGTHIGPTIGDVTGNLTGTTVTTTNLFAEDVCANGMVQVNMIVPKSGNTITIGPNVVIANLEVTGTLIANIMDFVLPDPLTVGTLIANTVCSLGNVETNSIKAKTGNTINILNDIDVLGNVVSDHFYGDITSNIVCVNSELLVNTIKPKNGGSVIIDGNLVVTGSFLSNILANIPEPLLVDQIIANTVCALGNVETNSIKSKTGNTINILNDVVASNISGTFNGDLYGNTFGKHFGNVCGDVVGNVVGNSFGTHIGTTVGDVIGNLTGTTVTVTTVYTDDLCANGTVQVNTIVPKSGNTITFGPNVVIANLEVTGTLIANIMDFVLPDPLTVGTLIANTVCALGNVETNSIKAKTGNTINILNDVDVLGNLTGTLFIGDISGNLNGNSFGKHFGNVCGDVTGNVIGNTIGTHIGQTIGDVTGNLTGTTVTTTNLFAEDICANGTVQVNTIVPKTGNTITIGSNVVIANLEVTGTLIANIMDFVIPDPLIVNTLIANTVCALGNVETNNIKSKTGNTINILNDIDVFGNVTSDHFYGDITSNIVCVNNELLVNTIKPKYGGTVIIDGNLVVTGSFLSNILANIPEPLVVDQIIANTVCALGNVETNSIKSKTGNTINILNDVIASNISGTFNGDLYGNTFGKHFGNVCGDVEGNIIGNSFGTHFGSTIGDVTGNLTGTTVTTTNLFADDICANGAIQVNTIVPKSGNTVTIGPNVIIANLEITGTLIANIMDFVLPDPLMVDTLIANTVCALGNVETNSIKSKTGNTINILNDIDIFGNVTSDHFYGDITSNIVCVNNELLVNTIKPKNGGTIIIDGTLVVTGSFLSNILANIPEPLVVDKIIANTVCALGNVETNSIKSKTGNTINILNDVDVSGNITGSFIGDVMGNVIGDSYGKHTGNVCGDVMGNLVGNTVGTHFGPIIGDVTGNLTGTTVTVTSIYTDDVCANGTIQTNTIVPKSGNTITIGPNVIIGNLEVTGVLIANIMDFVLPDPLTVDILIANTICALGNVETNSIKSKTGNTINILNDIVASNISGTFFGDVTGNLNGDSFGKHTGNVCGNVMGDVVGNIVGNSFGTHIGPTIGDVTGNLTGTTINVTTINTDDVCANGTIQVNTIVPKSGNTITLGPNVVIANLEVTGTLIANIMDFVIPDPLTVGTLIANTVCSLGNVETNSIKAKTGNTINILNDVDVVGNITSNHFYGDITSNIVCVNNELLVNTIKPKNGGTITIDGNLIVTGSFLSNILANIPEPLVVDQIIANTVCALGNVETNSIKSKTGNSITILNDINSTGNIYGNLIGNTFGKHTGDVCGNIMGNLTGNSYGTHFGPVIGDITGNSYGTHFGPTIGDVTGNLTGTTVTVTNVFVEDVCANGTVQVNTIVPKTGNVITIGPNVIVSNLEVTGTLIANIMDFILPDPLIVNTLIANAVCALGNVETNSIKAKTGNTITILNDILVVSNVTGTFFGNITGNILGDSYGKHTGLVCGNVMGNLLGNSYGSHFGPTIGDVMGNVTGNSTGTHFGPTIGDVTGNLTGNSTGTHFGPTIGDVTGNLTGTTVTVTNVFAEDVCANGTVQVNTIVPKNGNTIVIGPNVIIANLEVTGTLIANIMDFVLPDPLIVNTLIANTVCALGNVETNSIKAKTGNTITILNDVVVISNITGTFIGDVTGNIVGNSFGKHTGPVCGDVMGNVVGNSTGTHFGPTIGDVTGNLTGNSTGSHFGPTIGDVTGNLTGSTVTVTNVFAEDVCANGAVQVNTIVPKSGNLITIGPNVIISNLEVTGTLIANIMDFILPDPLIVNTLIANTVCALGNIETNSIKVKTGNTITILNDIVVIGNITGTLIGDVTGNIVGNSFGKHTGPVCGDLMGNVTGNTTGTHIGDVYGNVYGNTTGTHFGDVYGNIIGDVTGNTTGKHTGPVCGDVMGNVTGNTVGTHTGDVYGNVTGNTFGKHTGPVCGDVMGNIVGNVTGNTNGTHLGNSYGTHVGPIIGDVTGNLIGDSICVSNILANLIGEKYAGNGIITSGNIRPLINDVDTIGDSTHKYANIYTQDAVVCGNLYVEGNIISEYVNRRFDAYYSPTSKETFIDTMWTDVPLNVNRKIDPLHFNHSIPDANVTINTTGTYLIQGRTTSFLTSATETGRVQTSMKLQLNGVDIPGTVGYMYNRNSQQGGSSCSAFCILDLNAGDTIKIQVAKISSVGNATARLLSEGSSLVITNV